VHLAANGLSESEIANDMVLGLTTATTLLHEAYDRLGVTSRAELRDAVT
jgi:ATP/maltotriose-dependent transcriptional regulator MalT